MSSAPMNLLRRVLRGRPRWRWVDDPDGVMEIAPLVCPLRYDVLTRKQFIEFIDAHRDLYVGDRAAFLVHARQQPYAVWLDKIVVPRHMPKLQGDPAGRAGWVDERMVRFVTLYDEMAVGGFDGRHPIEIRGTGRLLPTETGKSVPARFVLGDGSHRLAFLMTRGYTVIPRGWFRLRWFDQLVPFDSTASLARLIPLDEPTYAAYLSSLYTAPRTHTILADLVGQVSATHPERAEEIRTIMTADGFRP